VTTKYCLNCNKQLIDRSFNQVKKFCNYYCKKNFTLAKRRKDRIKNIKKKCAYCGKTFIQKFIQEVKYCSRHCCKTVVWQKLEKIRKIRRKTDPVYYAHERQLQKQWRENNKEKVKQSSKKSRSRPGYIKHRKQYLKEYYLKPENREKRRKWRLIWYHQPHILSKKKQYKFKNRIKIRKQNKKYSQRAEVRNRVRERTRYRLKNDPIFKLKCNVRTRIRLYVKRGLAKKTLPTSVLIGCSWEFLKNHLEKQFKPRMSWANYGKWHIDHYRPMASFNLFKQKELLKCCNFANLQPLWAIENLRKSDSLEF